MPRRGKKSEKPPLQFLERPVSVAKVQRHDPEVRAAFNPKEFFTESQTESSSVLNSWVSPQFDSSAAAAAPPRRGRRKVRAAVSLVDNSTQLCRKTSASTFPSLTFRTRTTASAAENQPRALTRSKSNCVTARRASETTAQGSTGDSTPTPAQVEDESIRSSPHPLLYAPCTPPCTQQPDALAVDTPEKDYGVKVTWRRRKELMCLLKERGFLSESDALSHS
ncbi:RAD9, HUS1, RAD1-interacting nuclear orphan protein 1 [Gouania willdenowi]|uniref:RAD9, HUS1, RAD1-interacting nuclear orphan protein 1 n=1 Tax=Gouania willdenowi TaxID=441366 RepID=A0A8C5DNS9_GOUWI|nr:RAD9, HUS1, RAD1-interacting nuclear orphan protein 1 [Gouania willdenowi]